MNLKKKMKGFFTLTRTANGGFTLVELIVVIAILAILAGVGIPVYSGYITKANKTADETLVNEIKNAVLLAYYADPDAFEAGSVVLSVDADPDMGGNAFLTDAVTKAFGNLSGVRLKHNGWTNTKGDIKVTIAGSNFADANGDVNMELLGAVDNLTGQLGQVMEGGALKLQNFPGYTAFLAENGISPDDTQLAANAAVLYLSQSSMAPENREYVANILADPGTWGYGGTFDLENSFIKRVTLEGKCTEFEALAMAYATMQGYCMQKDRENGNTEWADKFAAIDLTTKADGTTAVDDEIAVLTKLCQEFTAMVDADADGRYAFEDYLYGDNGDAKKDIDAYYGVIDGISENEKYLKENLDGSDDFYSSKKDFLSAYWDLEIASGEVAVIVTRTEGGQPQVDAVGMG